MSEDMRQANLSHLTLKQMTSAQRAEIKRRFEEFVSNFINQAPAPAPDKMPRVRKWVPGMKK